MIFSIIIKKNQIKKSVRPLIWPLVVDSHLLSSRNAPIERKVVFAVAVNVKGAAVVTDARFKCLKGTLNIVRPFRGRKALLNLEDLFCKKHADATMQR